MLYFFIVAFQFVVAFPPEKMSSFVIVDTEYGSVKGVKKMSALNAAYNAFLGIRYGSPPTGERRFKVR